MQGAMPALIMFEDSKYWKPGSYIRAKFTGLMDGKNLHGKLPCFNHQVYKL